MGTTYNWNNAAGGSFGVAGNWTPNGVPGTLDSGTFDLGSDSYTVSGDGTPGLIQIDTDTVTFTGSIEAFGGSGFSDFMINDGTAIFNAGTLVSQQEVMVGGEPGAAALEFLNGAVGTLTASNSATALDIGYDGDAQGATTPGTGSVLVDDSTLTILGGAYVGVYSAGSLTITDNAYVQFVSTSASYDNLEVAVNDSSVSGLVNVDEGATLNVGVYSFIGVNGAGTLAVSGGASATLDGVSVADNGPVDNSDAGNTGLVTADGTATVLTLVGEVQVGQEGNGTLAATNGAFVQVLPGGSSADELDVAAYAGSTGTIAVTSGATLAVGEFTVVGNAGAGTISFTDGATGSFTGLGYDSADGQDDSPTYALYLGGGGGSGTLTVDGASTSVSANAGILVGQYGNGLLSLTNGATLAVNPTIVGSGDYDIELGSFPGATGTLDVSGGAQLTGTAALFVGSEGAGTLEITTGGSVYSDAGAGNVSGALAYLSGSSGTGLIDDGLWDAEQAFSVGYQGSGTLTVQDGGTLEVDGDFLRVARDPGSTGTLTVNAATVTAPAAELTVGPAATASGDGTGGAGLLEIENGGTVGVGSVVIGDLAGGSGSIDVNGAVLNDAGNLTTGAGTSTLTAEADSSVSISGTLTIGGGGGAALVQITDGTGLYDYNAGITVAALGTLALDSTTFLDSDGGGAPLTLDGGTLAAIGPLDLVAGDQFRYAGIDITGGTAADPSAIIGTPGGTTTIGAGITFIATSVTVASTPTVLPDVLLIDSTFAPGNEIDGFAAHDTIDIAGEVYNTASYDVATQTLYLSNAVDPATLSIADDGDFTATSFSAYSDGNGGTDVSLGPPPCFVAGTRIATERGERAVETLRPGDRVRLAAGGFAPVIWIGGRRVDPAAHPAPAEMQPVRITAGALADGVPARDLLVSPDHALLLDGWLVEARRLVNGTSIRQDSPVGPVHYLHVELANHAVLLAEGAAAESYLDTGNRHALDGGGVVALHPRLAGSAELRRAGSCAPLASDDATVQPIWQSLAARAALRGEPPRLPPATTDARPCLIADGRVIAPAAAVQDRLLFPLPHGTTRVRLASAAAPPAALRPWADDRRRLGLAIHRLRLHAGGTVTDIALDGPGPAAGWHAAEAGQRWTDGDAALTLPHPGELLEVLATPQPAYALAAPHPVAGRAAQAR